MCGIAGIVKFNGLLDVQCIVNMTNKLSHRGPDDEGYIACRINSGCNEIFPLRGPHSAVTNILPYNEFNRNCNLYLGHRRLSILDLSANGHQPMAYKDKLWIVYNGEIYNYIELREELKTHEYQFTSASDTEVILAAYDLWGEDCVSHFNGDWALCILNLEKSSLFLSRDRYGVKPLYFFADNFHFVFASEIKSLLTLPFVTSNFNNNMVSDLIWAKCIDHTDQTLFKDVFQILPGTNMEIDLRSGKRISNRYYTVPFSRDNEKYDHNKVNEYAACIKEILYDSVRLRMRSDVPVGTCLSGGIDSSVIAILASKILGDDSNKLIQTSFTASFPGKSYDESRYALIISNMAHIKSYMTYPSEAGLRDVIEKILYYQDEAFGGASVYAQWEVARLASSHVKVLLDGQGGDELFAGYPNYQLSYLAGLVRQRQASIFIHELFEMIRKSSGYTSALKKIASLLIYLSNSKWRQRIFKLYYEKFNDPATSTISGELTKNASLIDRTFNDDVDQMLREHLEKFSLPHLLKYEDRNSMAWSIEARVPFLDYRLVDYVFQIPVSYKIRDGWTKWILRIALKDIVPDEIRWRVDKIGFFAPVEWMTLAEELRIWKNTIKK